jgi:hypothetical protein
MKKIIKHIIFLLLLGLLPIMATAQVKDPGDPDPGGPQGGEVGGGAPIGSGLFILFGLGAAYAGKKMYNLKKEDLEE